MWKKYSAKTSCVSSNKWNAGVSPADAGGVSPPPSRQGGGSGTLPASAGEDAGAPHFLAALRLPCGGGASPYVKAFADVAVVAPTRTDTSTIPAACGGTVAVITLGLITVTPVAATPPNLTIAPSAKPDPVTMTFVPAKPLAGDTERTAASTTVPR